jgi:hypothetical protein
VLKLGLGELVDQPSHQPALLADQQPAVLDEATAALGAEAQLKAKVGEARLYPSIQ